MIEDIIKDRFLPELADKGKISSYDIGRLVKEAKIRKKNIIDYLIETKLVSDTEMEKYISENCDVHVVDPLTVDVREEVVNLIDMEIARKYGIVPIEFEGQVLTIATSNPKDIIAIDDLCAIIGYGIRPFYAIPYKLKKTFYKVYKLKDESEEDVDIEEIIAEATSEDLEIVEESDTSGDDVIDIQSTEETPVVKVTNLILSEGIKRGASDIFIEPWGDYMTIRCRVDGLLEQMKAPPASMANSIVSRIKVLSHLDIAERRVPQDGRFKIKYRDRFVEFRVSILPSNFGEKVCLRILDKKARSQSLDDLGFTDDELDKIKAAAKKPHGMILVTGPTGSGKTTTLYSILAYIDSPEKNITTVEEPVEYQIYGINQVNIRESVGLTFPAALRSILRQDPDVIMVGEIRDFVTMDIAIKAALTGHLVLSTLHTNDACGSIVRMTNMGIEPFLIASSVLMVSAQRLLRKLCPECKETYNPDDKVLSEVNLPKGEYTFYRPVGCDNCRGTGYAGRTVITEVLPVTQAIREAIMKRATGDEIKSIARSEGMRTLRESGISRVVAGLTSVEEVFRVTAPDK